MPIPITIRSETPADYAAIAAVHVCAFNGNTEEPTIVDLHRHRPQFDPELSLLAEANGRVVGHLLFTPRVVRLMGQDVHAVNLAPVAVHPACQRQGVGSRLIAEGHHLVKAKGYPLSFVLGHPTYYPRLGYRTYAYGASKIAVTPASPPPAGLTRRKVLESDIPTLLALWRHEESAVDFAIEPGRELLEWLSPHPAIKANVYEQDGQVVGYTRIHTSAPAVVRYFLARDGDAARAMAAFVAAQAQTANVELPLHPANASTAAFEAAFGTPECHAWDAGMAMSLMPNPFDDYYPLVQAGERTAGRVIWPVEFDLG